MSSIILKYGENAYTNFNKSFEKKSFFTESFNLISKISHIAESRFQDLLSVVSFSKKDFPNNNQKASIKAEKSWGLLPLKVAGLVLVASIAASYFMPGDKSIDLLNENIKTLVSSQDSLPRTAVLDTVKKISLLLPLQGFIPREFESIAMEIQGVKKPDQKSLKPFSCADICGKVLHIAQRHYSSRYGYEQIEGVWKSQVKIVKELQKRPEVAVFMESLAETSHNYQGFYTELVNIIFPAGIPNQERDWSPLQKKFLAERGAPRILHYLGILPTLYRAINPVLSERIDKEIKKGLDAGLSPLKEPLKSLIFDTRDKALAEEVKKFFMIPENKNREVIVIFGAAHDFSRYFPSEKFSKLDLS